MTTRRFSPVRFVGRGPLGLVDGDDPRRFVDEYVRPGDTGELLVEGDPPFTTSDQWVLVLVLVDGRELWCPCDPSCVEVVS